jgi:phospholipase/carboxylesterase
MSYSIEQTAHEIVLKPVGAAKGTVIWLHGLGADGHDFVPIVAALALPATLALKFVFPHAPERPITLNGGYRMRGWYDIAGLTLDAKEDVAGIGESEQRVRDYIAREQAQGTAPEKIVLAGFSQGSAIAIHTALRYSQPLAGLIALSGYLLQKDALAIERSTANKYVPIFMAHGDYDDVVPPVLAQKSLDVLQRHGYQVEWHSYPIGHEVSPQEVADIAQWLRRVFTPGAD